MASSLFQTVHCPAPFVIKQHCKRRSVAVSTPCRRPAVCGMLRVVSFADTAPLMEDLVKSGIAIWQRLVYLYSVFWNAANQVHHTPGVPETFLLKGGSVLLSLAAAFAVSAAPAMAEIRLPPIDNGGCS